jgi:polysaccharide biosynthesis/export protein
MKSYVSRSVFALMALFVFAGCATLPPRAERVLPYQPDIQTLNIRKASPGQVGQEDVRPAIPPPGGAAAAEEPARRILLPGDRLVVTLRVYPKAETFECAIDENGSINLDLVGRVKIGGISSAEAEKMIEKAYVDGQIYKTITVSIIPPVREFFVKGYVIRPGNYPIASAKTTVLQALTMAGGWNEFADPSKVRLVRGEEIMILNIPKIQARTETDVYIEPGDVIDVPKRWM